MQMRILWRRGPKLGSTPSSGPAAARRSESNPRATTPGSAAGIFHRPSFWFDFRNTGAAFHLHDLIAQKGCPLEFEVRRSFLHLFFQFAQQFSHIEIAAGLLNNGRRNFATAKNGMQTLLHGAPNRLRGDAVLFVVFHLLRAPVFGNRDKRFHALGELIGEEYYFTIHMARGATGGLDQGSLAPQETFLVRVENAHERNFGKIEPFTKQIDSHKNVEIRRS